jgi:hypothetical protein
MSGELLHTTAIKIDHKCLGPEMFLFRVTTLVSFLIHAFSTVHYSTFVASPSRLKLFARWCCGAFAGRCVQPVCTSIQPFLVMTEHLFS